MDDNHAELEARLAAARNFKRSTFGAGMITPAVFGEEHDFAVTEARIRELANRRNRPKPMTAEQRKRRQQGCDFRQRIKRCAIVKQRNGGIVGVYQYVRGNRKPKWHANTAHGNRTFDCAIAAAEARNKSVEQTTPGVDDLKCDIDAVWRRWGCSCQKHKREI